MRGELTGFDEDIDRAIRAFMDEMNGRQLSAGCVARLPIVLSWQ
jgi:hypothetical protein